MSDPVIQTKDLVKDHYSNFLRKRFRGLDGIDLTVMRGEAFGLLGPNGAGKTTTQKLLLGLLRPTSGTVRVLGYEAGDPRALERIGFLPENPYFYSYLTAGEFLDFFGQLFRLSKAERKSRSEALLDMVSLSEAGDKPIRKFSKGMLQRLGVAQCLINDPDLVFLDEPNSGLDPVGRRDIRNIIMQLKNQGKTIFLNSHLLPDVSELCDRVMILHRGRCVAEARTKDISNSGNYHDLEEYFMHAIGSAEAYYQDHKGELDGEGPHAKIRATSPVAVNSDALGLSPAQDSDGTVIEKQITIAEGGQVTPTDELPSSKVQTDTAATAGVQANEPDGAKAEVETNDADGATAAVQPNKRDGATAEVQTTEPDGATAEVAYSGSGSSAESAQPNHSPVGQNAQDERKNSEETSQK
jgi:ABC-2 type transport system ATP-binding protein